ncbi:MAG: transglutaminase domain-containing protein [Candidatus Promineifilaceae bacterium]|nr:transglutaminase domain-containing protein [Candidatus Promineifilaceae bacterium]
MRIRPRLEEGWTTLLLLAAMLLVASSAIVQTELISGLEVVPMAAMIGMVTGLALAKSHFKSSTAHVFGVIFGLFTVTYLVGLILPEGLIWRERVFDMIARQITWLQKAFGGGTSRDGLIFVIQTTAVYWLLGYTSAWYTFRYPRVWRAILPMGLVLLSVVYYYNGPRPLLIYLAAFAVLALLFIARTNLAQHEISWRSAAVRYEKGIWFDFLRAALIIGVFILFLSWSLPTLSASTSVNDALSSTQGPWREFQDEWTRLFSALRSYGGATADPYQETLSLGGPRTVGSTLIMDISVPRQLPYVYWQAIAYETYGINGWEIADQSATRLHYPDDGVLPVPATRSRQDVKQVVTNYLPNSSFIYAAPEVISTDRQMFVESTYDEQGRELVSAVRSRYVLRQGDDYEVTSRMSNADAESLRLSGRTYPQWITERYLQVPETVTPETLALAEELTAEFDNPFDKSIAVRDYLRNNIRYNDQISAPPDGVDPVHYVLFDLQEGYCNYYASAMAIMLRSQGVPARVVSGYAQGDFDENTLSYRVRANNAHTWVEVYFPNFGWIQFEPTASIPTVDRPLTAGGGDAFASPSVSPLTEEDRLPEETDFDPDESSLEDLLAAQDADRNSQSIWQDVPIWQAIGAFTIILIAAAAMFTAHTLNRRVEEDVDRSYSRLGSWARWLGIFYRPTQTPYERADLMASAVPDGQAPIRNLTREYVRKQFSADHKTGEGFQPIEEWRVLRPLLIRQSIINRFHKWQQRFSKDK